MGNYCGNLMGCGVCGKPTEDSSVTKVTRKRGCTDIPMLLLFVAFWAAIWAIWVEAKRKGGNVERIRRGVDYQQRICGVGSAADEPLVMWPDPTVFSFRVCVASCGETGPESANPSLHSFMAAPFPGRSERGYRTEKFINYCLPVAEVLANLTSSAFTDDSEGGSFNSGGEILSRGIADFTAAWRYVVVSGFVALGLSFLYTLFIRRFAKTLVFLAVLLITFGGFLIGWTLLQRSQEIEDSNLDPDRAKAMRILSYVFIGGTFLFLLVMWALRKRIYIAIEVVKEAARAIGSMPSLVFVPVFPFMIAGAYFVWWIYGAMFMFSVPAEVSTRATPQAVRDADPSAPDTYVVSTTDSEWKKALYFHCFGLLWNMQFMIFFTFMIIAGAIADWYFSVKSDQEAPPEYHRLGKHPVCGSLWRTVRYHMGTIAFGAAIIAVVQFVRATVKYLEEQSKAQANGLQKALFCCVQCCLKCIQYCLEKLSKNAFVWTAVNGTPFLPSAFAAFALLWQNLARVAAISAVSEYLLVLGKGLVAILTAGVGNYLLTNTDVKHELTSTFVPLIAIFLLAYLVASLFMVLYDTAIETIFLCLLIDEKHNGPTGRMFAPKSLQELVAKHEAASREAAEKIQGQPPKQPAAQDSV